jgi:hypothetical protein
MQIFFWYPYQGIAGDGLSGWLVIQIPRVRYGLIGAKFEVRNEEKEMFFLLKI